MPRLVEIIVEAADLDRRDVLVMDPIQISDRPIPHCVAIIIYRSMLRNNDYIRESDA